MKPRSTRKASWACYYHSGNPWARSGELRSEESRAKMFQGLREQDGIVTLSVIERAAVIPSISPTFAEAFSELSSAHFAVAGTIDWLI